MFGLGVSMDEEGTRKEHFVEIRVLGQNFSVKSDSDETHVREVARYVNEKIDEIMRKTKTVSSLNVAILTALNIADDLLKEREKRMVLLKEIGLKSKDLIEKIDVKMGGKEAEKVSIAE